MMVTLNLKIAEYNYLRRILPWVADELEEFAPWDIDTMGHRRSQGTGA